MSSVTSTMTCGRVSISDGRYGVSQPMKSERYVGRVNDALRT